MVPYSRPQGFLACTLSAFLQVPCLKSQAKTRKTDSLFSYQGIHWRFYLLLKCSSYSTMCFQVVSRVVYMFVRVIVMFFIQLYVRLFTILCKGSIRICQKSLRKWHGSKAATSCLKRREGQGSFQNIGCERLGSCLIRFLMWIHIYIYIYASHGIGIAVKVVYVPYSNL